MEMSLSSSQTHWNGSKCAQHNRFLKTQIPLINYYTTIIFTNKYNSLYHWGRIFFDNKRFKLFLEIYRLQKIDTCEYNEFTYYIYYYINEKIINIFLTQTKI